MVTAQQYFVLPNGLQVVIDQDERFPLVSMRLYVRAGSAYEQSGQEGISHFLEHMVFKGTEKRGPGQIAREVEEAGGNLNAGTSFDYTVYTVDLPVQEWKLGLDVLQDMIFGSTFDSTELNQEKNVVLAEIQRSKDSPESRIFKSIQSMVFKNTPYEHPILGFKDTVQGFTPKDLKQYISRLYHPRSMVLAISGDIDAQEVLDQTSALFGDLKNQGVDSLPAPLNIAQNKRPAEQRVRVEHGPWKKAYLSMAVPAPELSSADTPAFDILAYLLAGDRTSLLYREFKYDQGLVDQISAQVLSLERTGLMYFYTRLDPDELESFWNSFNKRLSDLSHEDFSREQIDRAVTNIEEGLFKARETLGGTASRLGYNQLFEKTPDAEEKYLHNLRRVTKQDLQDIIDKHLQPNNFTVSALVPEQIDLSGEIFTDYLKQTPDPDTKVTQESEPEDDDTRIVDLGGGRKLVIIPDNNLPYTSVSISWPGGSRLVSPEQQGLPELSARTITRGTRDRSFEHIQEFLKDRASSVNASSSRNTLNMSARFPVQYSQDIMELIAEMILNPAFSPDELKRAASDQIAEIKQQEDRPMGYAFRHLFPFLFTSGPYSYLHLGEEHFIKEVTPDMTRSFWEEQKTLPFVISVCGSVDQQALDNLVNSLSTIDTVEKNITPDLAWSEQKTRDEVLKDRAQAHILMVFPVPGKDHEHTPALKVMNKILSGMGGILFRELRDRQGLAYTVTSMLWQKPDTGFLALYIGTYEDKVDEAVKGFEKIVDQLRSQEVSEEEVDRAANLIFGEYYRGRQTIASRSAEAASLLVQGLDMDFNLEITEKARQVSTQDIKKLAEEYLDPDRSYLMRILPQ
ncbi:MAG: pitrilysin family protein [Desulfonatronovibrio sp.]